MAFLSSLFDLMQFPLSFPAESRYAPASPVKSAQNLGTPAQTD